MKAKYNDGVDVRAMAAGLSGLQHVVLEVLVEAVGRENAMPRDQLVRLVRRHPEHRTVSERLVRLAIHELRTSGKALICSTGGINGGYWIAANREEVEEFIAREIEPRAMGLLETKKVMLVTARMRFEQSSPIRQHELFTPTEK